MTRALLDDLAALAMLLALEAVLIAALVMQFGYSEAPCPLCLLQRVAMFGACFGLMLGFRPGAPGRATGIGLGASAFLLVVAVRQVLLDIVPRPGHAYVGSAVMGLHMPVWSVVIAAGLIAGFAARLALFGAPAPTHVRPAGIARAAGLAGLGALGLAAANFAAVLGQCGLGACHTG